MHVRIFGGLIAAARSPTGARRPTRWLFRTGVMRSSRDVDHGRRQDSDLQSLATMPNTVGSASCSADSATTEVHDRQVPFTGEQLSADPQTIPLPRQPAASRRRSMTEFVASSGRLWRPGPPLSSLPRHPKARQDTVQIASLAMTKRAGSRRLRPRRAPTRRAERTPRRGYRDTPIILFCADHPFLSRQHPDVTDPGMAGQPADAAQHVAPDTGIDCPRRCGRQPGRP